MMYEKIYEELLRQVDKDELCFQEPDRILLYEYPKAEIHTVLSGLIFNLLKEVKSLEKQVEELKECSHKPVTFWADENGFLKVVEEKE